MNRLRLLGMEGILPGFQGNVPMAMHELFPSANTTDGWLDATGEHCLPVLAVSRPRTHARPPPPPTHTHTIHPHSAYSLPPSLPPFFTRSLTRTDPLFETIAHGVGQGMQQEFGPATYVEADGWFSLETGPWLSSQQRLLDSAGCRLFHWPLTQSPTHLPTRRSTRTYAHTHTHTRTHTRTRTRTRTLARTYALSHSFTRLPAPPSSHPHKHTNTHTAHSLSHNFQKPHITHPPPPLVKQVTQVRPRAATLVSVGSRFRPKKKRLLERNEYSQR
jgi:hypothetical protein